MNRQVWHILTGEYPPDLGGVGDYTAQVAAGLAASGAVVHVWTSSTVPQARSSGVNVHPVAGSWSRTDLARLGSALDAFPAPRRVLVQYTPYAWGYKGLNIGFCRWLLDRRRSKGDDVRLMFHEVAYPWKLRDWPTRWVLGAGHRWMAQTLLGAATSVDVTTPAWGRLLRSYSPGGAREIGWRPVPANVPVVEDAEAVAAVRRKVAPEGQTVVGSFSTFSPLTGPLLAAALPRVLLRRPDCVGLLIGKGGDRLAARVVAERPALAGRVFATGTLGFAGLSAHLQATDLAVQLYPDGITTRRTSVMAALYHGIPVVSNAGRLTEPFWAGSGAVGLAPGLARVVPTIEALLDCPGERRRLGLAGLTLYARRFALELTVEALLGRSPGAAL